MCFFFQAEDGIRDLVRSRGLGDVYKRQANMWSTMTVDAERGIVFAPLGDANRPVPGNNLYTCLLYTSDAADERSSVDLGGRRIIQKKTNERTQKD